MGSSGAWIAARSTPRCCAGHPVLPWRADGARLEVLGSEPLEIARRKFCIAVVDPAARRSSLGYTDQVIRRHAMKVLMFVKATKQIEASQPPPTDEARLAMHKFNEELEKA